MTNLSRSQNFFSKLIDIRFNQFIATRVIGIIYIFVIGLIAIAYPLALLGALFQGQFGGFFGILIVYPIVAFIYICLIRVAFEAVIANIRTAQNTTQILEEIRGMINSSQVQR